MIQDYDMLNRAYTKHRNTPGNLGRSPNELILGRKTKSTITTHPENYLQRKENILTKKK